MADDLLSRISYARARLRRFNQLLASAEEEVQRRRATRDAAQASLDALLEQAAGQGVLFEEEQ